MIFPFFRLAAGVAGRLVGTVVSYGLDLWPAWFDEPADRVWDRATRRVEEECGEPREEQQTNSPFVSAGTATGGPVSSNMCACGQRLNMHDMSYCLPVDDDYDDDPVADCHVPNPDDFGPGVQIVWDESIPRGILGYAYDPDLFQAARVAQVGAALRGGEIPADQGVPFHEIEASEDVSAVRAAQVGADAFGDTNGQTAPNIDAVIAQTSLYTQRTAGWVHNIDPGEHCQCGNGHGWSDHRISAYGSECAVCCTFSECYCVRNFRLEDVPADVQPFSGQAVHPKRLRKMTSAASSPILPGPAVERPAPDVSNPGAGQPTSPGVCIVCFRPAGTCDCVDRLCSPLLTADELLDACRACSIASMSISETVGPLSWLQLSKKFEALAKTRTK